MTINDERLQLLRSKIAEANQLLTVAETELEAQVKLLAPVLAGDKQVTTEGLERSFERLIAARRVLISLETLLTDEP